MKLYDYWRSSSAWRVRIALAYKGIAYQRQAVNLLRDGGEQHRPDFTARNPMAQVPVLELELDEDGDGDGDGDGDDGGGGDRKDPRSRTPGPARVRFLSQSMAILEYLEERFPSPPLLPTDPWLRGRARQLAETINAGIQPLHTLSTVNHVKSLLGGDGAAWMAHFIGRGLTALEAAAGETAAAFLVGDAPSFADVYLIPQLYAARRFGIPVDGFPTLLRAEASAVALPAFAAAHADRQPDKPPG